MIAKKKSSVPVSVRALVQRINRALAEDGQRLKKPRSERWWNDLGDYYVLDLRRNSIVKGHVDPEALGREMGVLKPWEGIAD